MTSAGKRCLLCCPLAEPQDVIFSRGLEGGDQEGLAGREVPGNILPRVKHNELTYDCLPFLPSIV